MVPVPAAAAAAPALAAAVAAAPAAGLHGEAAFDVCHFEPDAACTTPYPT